MTTNDGPARLPAWRRRGELEVVVAWSVWVVMVVLAIALAVVWFPDRAGDPDRVTAALAATGVAVLAFGSLMTHGLGHLAAARHHGIEPARLVVTPLAAEIELGVPSSAAVVEQRVAAAGLLVSGSLAVLAGALALLLGLVEAPALLTGAVATLAGWNVLLVVANLVPAVPFDGGRLVRSSLWLQRGDRRWATGATRLTARGVGTTAIGAGLVIMAAGAPVGALVAVAGWLLFTVAAGDRGRRSVEERLLSLRARDVMSPDPVTVPAWWTVEQLLGRLAMRVDCSAFPVEDRRGRVRGLVSVADVKRCDPADWSALRVGRLARGFDEVPVVGSADGVVEVAAQVAGSALGRALVVDDGVLVGIVAPSDLARALQWATADLRRAGPSADAPPTAERRRGARSGEATGGDATVAPQTQEADGLHAGSPVLGPDGHGEAQDGQGRGVPPGGPDADVLSALRPGAGRAAPTAG